jgi:hypothetical protein
MIPSKYADGGRLPSTDPSTWDAVFDVGDKVKIRINFNDIADVEKVYKITKVEDLSKFEDVVRDKNPSGRIYTLSNNQDWEGKDLELVERANANQSTPTSSADTPAPIVYNRNTNYNVGELTEMIKNTKKELSEWIGLRNVMSTTDTGELLYVNAQINEKNNELSTLLFDKMDKEMKEDKMLDDMFEQSLMPLKNRYPNVMAGDYDDNFAPNGQKSEWSDQINEIIKGSLFKDFFGDWEQAYSLKDVMNYNLLVSKVVNENYEPQIVWHGTDNPFSYFKFETFPAAYFAVNPEYSLWFAEAKAGVGNGYVYPFFLNVRNPLDLTMFGIEEVSPNDFFAVIYMETGLKKEDLHLNPLFLDDNMPPQPAWVYLRNNPNMLQKIYEDNVYDGIHFYEFIPNLPKDAPNYQTEAWVVFRAENIKLADPDRGYLLMSSLKSFILQKGGKI